MKIQINLNSKARILAGLEPADSAVVELAAADIPEELRASLALCTEHGGIYSLPYTSGGNTGTMLRVPAPAEGTPATVVQYLRDYQSARAAWQATQDAERSEKVQKETAIAQEYIALPVADRVCRRQQMAGYGRGYREYWEARCPADGAYLAEDLRERYYAARTEANTEALRRDEQSAREQEETTARHEAEEAAAAARKHAQLTDAVARLGDESQQARWAEGMLPAREAVDLIVSESLAPLTSAGLTLLDEPPVANIDHAGEDSPRYCEPDPSISTDSTVLTKLSRDTYAALRRVREISPTGATVEAVRDIDTCDACGSKGKITYIRATWTVGEIKVTTYIAT